jgi:hypothetical protein
MAISFKGAHFPHDIILMGVRWYVAWLCRKFCAGGHEGAIGPVCVGIKQPGSRTVRPQ